MSLKRALFTLALGNLLAVLQFLLPMLFFVAALLLTAALFYRWKLKAPLAILSDGANRIMENDLDFTVAAISNDELGRLCAAFETMRQSLLENNRLLWRQTEERKRLNVAFSHDLRNPVTVLKGSAKLARRCAEAGNTAQLEENLDRIDTYTDRIEHYVETMSTVQRLEQLEPKPKDVNTAALSGELQKALSFAADEGEKQLIFHGLTAPPAAILLDKELLFQIAENLTANALRFARETVTVTLCVTGGQLTLTVADDGGGYPLSLLNGILESSYLGYSSGTVQGIVGKGSAEVLLPAAYRLISTDFKTQSKQDFQRIVRELAETLQVDAAFIQYNPVLLNALGIAYDADEDSDTGSGFPFMAATCVLVGALVLLAAGLVIYNILKISISKRVREYGTLRAIGAQRGQVYRLVSVQLLLLCGIGIPVGLLLGVLSAKGVLIAATGALNPDIFMANSAQELNSAISGAAEVKPIMLLASIAVTLTFAMLAAFPAARYAARVSPTVAMSGQTAKIKRRIRKSRTIHHFEAWYARLNLKRGRCRTAITILSLVMSITVFVALQSFTGLLDASSAVQDMYTGDYALTNEDAGISAEGVEKLRANDAVAQLSTTRLSVFMPDQTLPFDTNLSLQGHETLQLASVDEAQLSRFAPTLSAQDKQALLDGTGCLVKNPIALSYGGETVQQTSLAVGDVVKLGDKELRVVALLDSPVTIGSSGFTNGVQILVSDAMYCELTGSDYYAEVCPTLKKDADTAAFETWMDGWCGKNPGTQWLSYRQSSQEMAESFAQIKMLCWVLIALIGVIGVLNIINTVYSNIHTRIDEIGMQRAIGMSAASLYKTFLWEGAYYGIFASVIGAVLGYVCCIFVGAAQTDTLQLVAVPVAAILEAAAVSVAACLAATAIPLRAIFRMSIVDSIETGE